MDQATTTRKKTTRKTLSKADEAKKKLLAADPILAKLVSLTNKAPKPFSELCNRLDLSPKALDSLIQKGRSRGLNIMVEHDHIGSSLRQATEVKDVGIVPTVGEVQKIGVISDLHFGSKYCLREQLKDCVNHFYDKEGVREILVPGDVTEGMYTHAKFERSHEGLHDQVFDMYQNLPHLKGLTYHCITGNHDVTHINQSGVDFGMYVEDFFRRRGRNDVFFYGDRGAYLQLRGAKIHMWHPGGGGSYALCYDDQTEVLTRSGWKLFKDVKDDDEVATLNENHDIEWHAPEERYEYRYSGEMVQMESRLLDLCVTPSHNLYVSRDGSGDWGLREAKDCLDDWLRYEGKPHERGWWRMKKNANPQYGPKPEMIEIPEVKERENKPVLHLGEVDITIALRFLGYYTAEGCVTKGRAGHDNGVTLSQYRVVNPETHLRMEQACRGLGVSPFVGDKAIMVSSRELAEFALQCGRGSENKKIPLWIKELDSRLLSVFFEAYMEGDGTVDQTGHMSATTKSKQLADDLQEVALRLGFSASISFQEPEGYEPFWCVSFNKQQNEPRLDRKPVLVPYDGIVYCLQVPNHTLYVRRNGKACWSGNSYKLQNKVAGYLPGHKPQILLTGHWHKFCHVDVRGVQAFLCGTFHGGGGQFGKSLGDRVPIMIGGLVLSWTVTETGALRDFGTKLRRYQECEELFLLDEVNTGDASFAPDGVVEIQPQRTNFIQRVKIQPPTLDGYM